MGKPSGTVVSVGSSPERLPGTIEAWLVQPGEVAGLHTQLGLSGEAAATLARAIERKQVDGTVGKSHLLTVGDREVILVGAGYKEGEGWRQFQTADAGWMDAAGQAVAMARGLTDIRGLTLRGSFESSSAVRIVAEASLLANHAHVGPGIAPLAEGTGPLENVVLYHNGGTLAPALGNELIKPGLISAKWQNWARTLVHLDHAVITPEVLIERAISAAAALNAGVSMDRLGMKELEARGYDLCLAVNQASTLPATGVVFEYQGNPGSSCWFDVVGKGVTKDTGGEALKPADGSVSMHQDMAGAASAFATFLSIVELGLPLNVRCRVIGVRNMIGPDGYSNGQVVTSGMLGKRVRIRNTDAEGRLVLVEQIRAAHKAGTALIGDLATLTGLAHLTFADMTAVWSTNPGLARLVHECSVDANDPAWPMPFRRASYQELLDKADGADISHHSESKEAGSIRAAEFLAWGANGTPFCHLDIAAQHAHAKTAGWRVAGGEAPQVRTLVRVFEAIAAEGQEEWASRTLGWRPPGKA